MKKLFSDAKKEYNSVEIPPELGKIIEHALNEKRNTKSVAYSLIHGHAPAAACALLLIVLSIGYFAKTGSDFDTAPSETALPVVASIARTTETAQITGDAAFEEKSSATINKKENEAEGKLTELYSDDEVCSYSVFVKSSNITNYHNICKADGNEITLESLIGKNSQFNSNNSAFYFKSKDELVVICDGVENIVKLK